MKEIMKKLLVLVLLVLVPAFVVKAQSGTNSDTGSITINNAVEDHTYTIYQVLELESYDTEKGAYTYTIAEGWDTFIRTNATAYVTATLNKNGKYVVTWNDGADKEAFAKAAIDYVKDVNSDQDTTNDIANNGSKDADESKVVSFTGLNLGYYLVDSSVGALCNLTTTKPNATVEEKNSVPTVEKEVKREDEEFSTSNTASVGDTLYFKTTINVTAGAENYVLYDKMDAGLTFDGVSSIKIYLNVENEENLVATTNYVASVCEGTESTTCTFKVDFTDEFELTLEDGDEIFVTYSAVLNEDAVVKGTEGDDENNNETYLKYGDGTESTHVTTKTYTFKFDLVKTDAADMLLDGAKFKLYTSETGTVEIALVLLPDGTYRVATEDETGVEKIIVTNGMVTISGLGNGTYWLEETDAPNGYNKLTSRVKVEISDANLIAKTLENQKFTNEETVNPDTDESFELEGIKYEEGGVRVINHTGAELPTTGGIGTMLFVIIGSIMVLGFGVLLVTKLRLSKMSA